MIREFADAQREHVTGPVNGLVRGVPMDRYHADRLHVSRSQLLDARRSWAYVYATHFDPARPPRKPPTPAMVLGTLVHTLVLEPETFASRYVVPPKVDRRTTAGKADWAAFTAALLPGQELIDADMAVQAKYMAASVLSLEVTQNMLMRGEPELSVYWTDKESGMPCRCRPDWLSPGAKGGRVTWDVKSTIDASPEGFARQVVKMGYDFQAAYYSDGVEAATGEPVHGFVFLAVEKDYPFQAVPHMLAPEDIERARKLYKRDLLALAECKRTGVWPGFTAGDNVNLLTLPAWAPRVEEDEEETQE